MSRETFQKEAEGLLAKCVEQIAEGISALVGAPVELRAKEMGALSPDGLAGKVRKRAAVLMMDGASCPGRALAVFRFPEALLLAGTLLMVPAAQIKEQVRAQEMGQDMADAFTEVANIVYGAVDRITSGRSADKGKLRNEGIQLVDPPEGNGFDGVWPAGRALAAEMTVAFPGFDPGTAFLVFEEALLSGILGIEAGAAPSSSAGAAGAVLLFGKDAAIAGQIREFFSGMGIEAKAAETVESALEAIGDRTLLVVVEFTPAAGPEAARVCRAAGDGGRSIPVVGVSHKPTRETILSARKAGVRSFLVHPFSHEMLQAKVEPLLGIMKAH